MLVVVSFFIFFFGGKDSYSGFSMVAAATNTVCPLATCVGELKGPSVKDMPMFLPLR